MDSSPHDVAWSVIEKVLFDNMDDASSLSVFIPQPEATPSCLKVLKLMKSSKIEIFQSFRPEVRVFSEHHFKTLQKLPEGPFDLALFTPTRQRNESMALLAHSLLSLAPNGKLLFVCANSLGAGGYLSRIKELIPNLQAESAKKCRYFWISPTELSNKLLLNQWKSEGESTLVSNTNFKSIPGIYGWNKIDQGSELLIHSLPELTGNGADLGSGYGFLSHSVLKNCLQVSHLDLVEADFRSLQCAETNLQEFKSRCAFHWLDVTAKETQSKFHDLDFIIMNPPFHEGTNTDPAVGKSFIETAAKLLKAKGKLYMVANSFLSYEKTLQANFKIVKKVSDSGSFKVIHAER